MVQCHALKISENVIQTTAAQQRENEPSNDKAIQTIPAKMNVEYPYRAVICGEEHIVKGWRDGNLLTDKGEFVLRQLYRYAIQSARLVEVASLQLHENGEWLINGHNLRSLQSTAAGSRLPSITSDEPLRVYKGEIRAVVWVQRNDSTGNITELLDTILDFWKKPPQPVKEETNAYLIHEMTVSFRNLRIFAGLSGPIWLTNFHRVGDVAAEQTPDQIKLAKAAAEIEQKNAELRKVKAAANDNLKEALSKWMRFEPVGMKADTKARIEKAVKIYLTDPDKHSLKKIADEFHVSRTTVWKWFVTFTKETSFPVVTHERHESVLAHLKADSELDMEG